MTGLAVVVWHRSLEGLGLLVEVVRRRRRHVMLRLLALLLGLVLLEECCPGTAVRRFGAICKQRLGFEDISVLWEIVYWVDRQVVGRDFVCLPIELAS